MYLGIRNNSRVQKCPKYHTWRISGTLVAFTRQTFQQPLKAILYLHVNPCNQ